MQVALKRFIK